MARRDLDYGVAGAPELPFDLYGRYWLVSKLALIVAQENERDMLPRILDASASEGHLKSFLSGFEVFDVHPSAAGRASDSSGNRDIGVVGEVLPFGDDTFDLVVANDTLEHVRPELREQFIRELVRVCRSVVVLNGPVDDPQVKATENRLTEFWSKALSWDRHPLDDHQRLGLPRKELISNVLEELGLSSLILPNGRLFVWTGMMTLRSYLLALPDSEEVIQALDHFYNSNLVQQDLGGLCYRQAFIVAKNPEYLPPLESGVKELLESDQSASSAEQADLWMVVDKLESHSLRVRETIGHLKADLEHFKKVLRKSEKLRKELELSSEEQRAALAVHESALDVQTREVNSTRRLVAERDSQLKALLDEWRQVEATFGFRVLNFVWRVLKRLLPPESIRYKLFRRAVQVITRRPIRIRQVTVLERLPGVFDPGEYRDWIAISEPLTVDLQKQTAAALHLPFRPVISLVLPTWNTGLALMERTIESVQRQTYGHWELCIADGGSEEAITNRLRSLTESDSRIKAQFLKENLGISGNTNAAVAMAEGEFLAFLDHTDVLAPNALYEVAVALNRDPSLDCLYSDSDILMGDEEIRLNPVFTPGWSPDMLLSSNYMAHLLVARRSLVEDLGGLRGEFEGAQDWDLVLRISEKTSKIARIPKVLYHWRADDSSSALSLITKPYAKEAQERAVREHLLRRNLDADVERMADGSLRLRWKFSPDTRVSILIPTKGRVDLLESCLEAIASATHENWEVIVVDSAGFSDALKKDYEQLQAKVPFTLVWWEGPFNYSAVNNFVARKATGDVLLFLNDDTRALEPTWLTELVGWAVQEEIGAVGAQLVDPEGFIQHGGVVVGLGGFADHLFRGMTPGDWSLLGSTRWYRNVTAVTGACLALRRTVFEKIGGWNEDFELCGSDVELCIRLLKAGYRNICTPFCSVLHLETATRGPEVPRSDYFASLWSYQPYLHKGDPYFSPNLSYHHPAPKLAKPDETRPIEFVSRMIGRSLSRGKTFDAQAEALTWSKLCQIGQEEVEHTRKLHASTAGRLDIQSINWFIPDVENPFYGGVHTIYRFADYFRTTYGVKSRFAVFGSGPVELIRSGLALAFPDLSDSEIYLSTFDTDAIEAIPYADVSIASLWVTAYAVSKFSNTRRKFYLIQDFEPMFYPAGTLYALAEESYKLGLYGLANTSTLKELYEDSYGGTAVDFKPCVDLDVFHPAERRDGPPPFTVFLYGRPGHPRNCYELAIESLKRLKASLKDEVRIVTAGSWMLSEEEVPPYLLDNLGLLDYSETGALYRQCDAGLVLSTSKHPSYLPLQLMASGCLVVSNMNPAAGWLLRDEENCLLAHATAQTIASTLERGLVDDTLRERLTTKALADIRADFSNWKPQMERVFGFLQDPEGFPR